MRILNIAAIVGCFALVAAPMKTAFAVNGGGNEDRGRELFDDWSCGDCHQLAAAGASGTIGPALDGNANLSFDYVINRIENGQGAMPPFGGMMNEDEIADLAAFVISAAR